MWLVMHFDTSRNVTYNKVLAGKYQNIRMHTTPHNDQSDDALTTGTFDFYTSPPPPPYSPFGGYPEGGWLRTSVGTYANKTCRDGPYEPNMPECTAYVQPDDSWLDNSIDGFSAACWHFGEQLTDYMEANGEEIVPLGLIGSHWGGTMVEMWQPNATLNAQVCKNDTGHPWEPKQMARWDIGGGGLYNGMVLPFLLRSIYVQSIFSSVYPWCLALLSNILPGVGTSTRRSRGHFGGRVRTLSRQVFFRQCDHVLLTRMILGSR